MTLTDSRCPTRIPDEPDFSPADVAVILSCRKSIVGYWIKTGKLAVRANFRESPRINRNELIRFCRDYLHCKLV